ncbi:LysR family transcriptional regulator [Pseudoalteromonas sp. MEBiC 03607]|uniref:LysR family transcriptional regulator n=1 Tax=unclassified Pseudoalteromonas TaxID=194690 RepID=UPI00109344BD|nr:MULTISPECIES: LysR family transcriptional regulator [unclassified Pseudoalteromonas]MCO7250355.1 LysR family transcriptional regulator [Pseudoalteromonas sp. Ps84H-4]TGV18862.1 LysR family transcriptional regulator [Pseudoalteromonas sp. MEBiC 03607]
MHDAKSLFIRVVEAGSIKSAAIQLGVESSSISRKIAALEKQLGVKLLNRSTIRTTPTEQGQTYYERLKDILDAQQALDEEISNSINKVNGTLRIGAPVDFGSQFVVPVCRAMQKQYPDLNFELFLGSDFENLFSNKIDVAVRIGELANSQLIARKLGEIPRVLVASQQYLEKFGIPLNPMDLEQHNFIFYSQKQAKSDIEYLNFTRFPHIKMHSNFTVNSASAVRDLVINGAGIHLGPLWFFSEAIHKRQLTPLLTDYQLKSYSSHAVYKKQPYTPQKIKVFIDKMKEAVSTLHNSSFNTKITS